MTTEIFPSITPNRCTFGLQYNTRTFTSPLSGSNQTLEAPGARWIATLEYRNLSVADKREFMAFFAKLRGMAGRFYLHDFANGTPEGGVPGTPLVKGASQTGNDLITDGWTPSQADVLKAGDYIAFDTTAGRELKILVADEASDGSGNSTLTFEPSIRTAPADSATIITSNPTGIFMLDSDMVEFKHHPPAFADLTIRCVEAL